MDKLLTRLEKLEEFVLQNDWVDVATLLRGENGVDKAEDLRKTFLEQEKKDRVLKIGILGRVKAGKSSFLNALIFDGDDVLPKAATPMTAALTILEYGESTSAEVDFYTQEDIEGIKKEYEEYKKTIERLKEEKLKEIEQKTEKKLLSLSTNKDIAQEQEKVQRLAEQEAKKNERLFSSYDQYEKICKSGMNVSELSQYKNIQASNIEDLKNKLKDFIASDGKYMPFTKSVTLRLNNENLKDVQIIDTPGINDPVASRGERTRELLKDCDVCFLLSPSGQFLSQEDMDLLDRLTVREGVQEFYVVASQADSQLLGSCRDEANGVLEIAMQKVEESLSNHMKSTFTQQKQNYPAGFSNVISRFDKLMSHPVICTSGMAFSLCKKCESQWDKELAFVFKNLKEEYQDFFSNAEMSKSNLAKIANIEKIKELINEIRARKEEIQQAKQKEFIAVKSKGVEDYKAELLKFLKEKERKLQEGDLAKNQKEKDAIIQAKERGSVILDGGYEEGVRDLEIDLRKSLNQKKDAFFSNAKKASKNTLREERESYKVSTSEWYIPWTWGDEETRYRTYKIVLIGEVADYTQEMIIGLERMFDIDVKEIVLKWRNETLGEIKKTLREEIGDKFIEISMLERITKTAISQIQYPEIKLERLPQNLRGSGRLEGYQAEEYIKEYDEFFLNYQDKVEENIKQYVQNLLDELGKIKLSNQVFGAFEDEISRLEEEIQNKQSNLECYKKNIALLEEI